MGDDGDIIREVWLGSRIDWLAAPAAAARAWRIAGAANPADNFNGSWRFPVKRGNADRNSTLAAESCYRRISEAATRADDDGDRLGRRSNASGRGDGRADQRLAHGFKRCIATATAEPGPSRKARMTARAHDNAGHVRLSSSGATV